jgi:Replication-relaxation
VDLRADRNMYLRLVVPDRRSLSDSDRAAHRRWAAEVRTRAASIDWQPDGDVSLSGSWLGQRTDVVPDAAVRSERTRQRIFVELDRSTKALGRIREGLERYARVLPSVDLRGDSATVLFVVRSAARKANIESLARSMLQRPTTLVLKEAEAVEWLRREVLSLPPDPRAQNSLQAVATRAYSGMPKLNSILVANGTWAALGNEQPAFMRDGHSRLAALYQSLKALQGADR